MLTVPLTDGWLTSSSTCGVVFVGGAGSSGVVIVVAVVAVVAAAAVMMGLVVLGYRDGWWG